MPLSLDKIKILIVDDNKPIRELLGAIFDKFGIKQRVFAADGGEGFKVFQAERPDIVFVDWDMEPVSGIEMARMIRTYPHSVNPQVPIIMLSGYSAAFRILEARECGVTEFMTKPFTADAVAKRISHVINHPRDFVRYDDFTGPDRRRREDDGHGDERRGK